MKCVPKVWIRSALELLTYALQRSFEISLFCMLLFSLELESRSPKNTFKVKKSYICSFLNPYGMCGDVTAHNNYDERFTKRQRSVLDSEAYTRGKKLSASLSFWQGNSNVTVNEHGRYHAGSRLTMVELVHLRGCFPSEVSKIQRARCRT